MPDITMCNSKKCKAKKTCYRFMAKPDPYYQSYFTVDPNDPVADSCIHFWLLEPKKVRSKK